MIYYEYIYIYMLSLFALTFREDFNRRVQQRSIAYSINQSINQMNMHRLCVDDCVMMPGSLIQSINQFVCLSINESTNVLICLSTHPSTHLFIHPFSLPSIRKDFNDRSFQKVVGSLAMLLKSILSSSK